MRYRTKVEDIEAVQVTSLSCHMESPGWLKEAIEHGVVYWSGGHPGRYTILTSEGVRIADIGDWIIKDKRGTIYPCPDSIFESKYVPVVGEEVACG